MELFKSPSLADQLEDILDREYRMMLAADFVGLGRMLPLKETAFEQLEKSDADLVSLRSLRDKAERNQQMLDCVTRGVKSALSRLENLENQNLDLTTYDGSGQRQTYSDGSTSLKRRA